MTAVPTEARDAAAPQDPLGGQQVPMSRLVRTELRKMVDTRAGMWLFVAMGLLTAAAVTLFFFFADPIDLRFADFLGVTLTPQGFLLPVLGILLITSEWSQRTGLVTFTLEPSRSRVIVAKLAAANLIGLAVVVFGLAVATVSNALGSALQDGDGAWTFGLVGLVSILVLQLSAIVQGLAFGMVLLNSAAAIVLYFVLPIAFNIVFAIVGDPLADVAPWIDLGTAQTPLFELDEGLTGEEWAQVGVTAMLWIGLPLVAGWIRLLRSELKSA
jgi:ABC-type transport system involved in multi-copper enzyme maturation permease subunit